MYDALGFPDIEFEYIGFARNFRSFLEYLGSPGRF
jgi:hypothetical protein